MGTKLIVGTPSLSSGNDPLNPVYQIPPESLSSLRGGRVRILKPRFLGAEIEAVLKAQLAAQLTISSLVQELHEVI
jgi:hypothetical protein